MTFTKAHRLLQAFLLGSLVTSAGADSTVVFNEVMYHPQTNEAALEWVELYNQQAVGMDISGWSLANGIGFKFVEGTVIPGGGYVVVASSPNTLQAATGITNLLGPFTGLLANTGEKLELRSNNNRLMDSVNYGVEGDWPSGPDGAGVSLAKRDPDLGSASPESWRMSAQIGGTPGQPNFPVTTPTSAATTLVALSQVWKYDQSGTDLGTAWRQPGYGDGAWPSGPGLLGNETAAMPEPLRTQLTLGRSTYYFRTHFNSTGNPQQAALSLRHVLDDSMIVHLNGVEVYRVGLPEGVITYTNLANRSIGDAVSEGPFVVPNTKPLQGDNVLAVEVHQNALTSTDVVFGLALESSTTSGGGSLAADGGLPPLAFNELASSTNSTFWLELINHGVTSVPLAGHVIARFGGATNREYTLPAETLAPGALAKFPKSTLGFGVDSGDLLVLYAPGRSNVLDAVVAKKDPRGRHPDGVGRWLFPAQPTPGASNEFLFHDEIVIDEIMYHARDLPPLAAGGPWRDSLESWVELHNRSAQAVDLTGWRLDEGIDYRFTPGTAIPAGGYLVVAKERGYLQFLYPSLAIVGPFTNTLSGHSDYLVLKDANNNPANEVRYFDGGRWPTYPDGGGSSLELRDPWADNSKAEAWAASVEGNKSSWNTYTYRGVPTATAGPTRWNEFVLGLLDAGECLIDDLHVIESPGTTRLELLQNGSFEKGAASWRFLGTHKESRVIVDPANPANHVLHLVATGPTEHMHNHLETTFVGNRVLVNGREYEIAFRARWLAGDHQLNTRCYFNRLARTTLLPVPAVQGTPGARNSTYATNLGPTFARFGHSPVVPQPNQAVTVSVAASDPQGVTSCTLWWSTDSSAWSSAAMTLSGGVYRGTVPGFSAATLVQFYVQATDGLGTSSTYPAGGPNSRALYAVNDGRAVFGKLHNLRIIMTKSDADWLHAITNVMSNAKLGATVVYDEKEVFYDVGVKLQGSEHGRYEDNRVGFTIDFDPDHLFRGAQENVTVDRSSWRFQGGPHEEIVIKHMVNHAGGLPGMYDDLVRVIAPRAAHTGTGLMLMAKYGNGFLDSQYENGSDGMLFKMELAYPLSATVDGNPESQKVPQAGEVVGTDITDLGSDKELYRHFFMIENHRNRDDYSGLISLAKAFSLTGTAQESQTQQRMDLDEWMRIFAFEALAGLSDTFHYDNPHNLMLYFRPGDNRGLAFLWDMDFCFSRSVNDPFPGTASPNFNKIMAVPANRRAYFGHLHDLITTTYNTTYMSRWTTHYGGLLGQNWSAMLSYIGQRASFVQGRLPTATPFAITVNGGNDFNTGADVVTLRGTAPVQVKQIEVNGVGYALTWTTVTNWTVTVPIAGGSNLLALRGRDYRGNLLSTATDTITVVNPTAAAPPRLVPVVINEWMADNAAPGGFPDPADGLFQDWFELYNPNTNAFDLSNFWLTDDLSQPAKWRIPTNAVVAPRGFLLVWADGNTGQNGADVNGDLHASFQLSAGGESLGLFAPDGVALQSSVTFGPQTQNVSEGLFPDGNTNEVVFMMNWTPRTPNAPTAPGAPPRLVEAAVAAGVVTLKWEAVPGRLYRVEFKDRLSDPVWTPRGNDVRASATTCLATDQVSAGAHRFYRVQLVN